MTNAASPQPARPLPATRLPPWHGKRVGLALGGGGARGGAHVGVLRALEERGIRPHCYAGTSIGAIVCAFAAAEHRDRLEEFTGRLSDWRELGRLFIEFSPSVRGFIAGKPLMRELGRLLEVGRFEDLPHPFAAVATDLDAGRAVVFREGPLLPAIRASISIPGAFQPVRDGDRTLVDGGLVDPVPVRICRELGAEYVIAVDISRLPAAGEREYRPPPLTPKVVDILYRTIRVFEAQLAANRLALDQPDLIVSPPVAHLSTIDFLHSRDLVAIGYQSALDVLATAGNSGGVSDLPEA